MATALPAIKPHTQSHTDVASVSFTAIPSAVLCAPAALWPASHSDSHPFLADDDSSSTIRDVILTLPKVREHGGEFEYRSIETDVVVQDRDAPARDGSASQHVVTTGIAVRYGD